MLLVTMILTGCTGQSTPDATSPPPSGVRGRSMIDGGCPVIQVDSPCPDKPFQAKITVFPGGSDAGVVVATTDPDGRFEIGLPPGNYRLEAAAPAGGALPRASAVDFVVPAGGYADVAVVFDSGIR